MVKRDPSMFAKMFSLWESLCESEEVGEIHKKRKDRGLAAAVVLLASVQAEIKPEKEMKFWKAMKQLLNQAEARNYTTSESERDLIAGLLVLATEIVIKKKK